MNTRLVADRRGTAAIEVAIILPVFITLLVAMFDVGRAMWTLASLQSGADAAARCYAMQITCTSAATTASYVSTLLGITVPAAAVTATAGANCGGGITGSKISIARSYTFVAQGLLYSGNAITMTVSACYPT